MPAAKQIEPDTINKSLETDIEKNVYEVNRASDEMAANTIATLLRRACKASTCEIDNLIGELRGLREKLETDRNHLESDIAEHAKLSQAVTQLTGIGSDSVKDLPTAPRISQ
jgi:hypothetical protein